jgi:mannose-1-phosphate guanylyltransferase
MQGCDIGPGCVLRECVVAAGTHVGAGTQITGGAVIGEGVTVGADNVLTRGVRVFPHVSIPDGAIRF